MVDKTGTIGRPFAGPFQAGHFTAGTQPCTLRRKWKLSGSPLFPPRPRLCYRGFLRTNAASVVFSTRTRGTRLQRVLPFSCPRSTTTPDGLRSPLGTLILFLWLMSNNNRRRDD
ncbi:MAG: hypothetical protein CM1200mP2_05350 [Planctomycetaceae bacterium]|nr:MAG: hypothetical protein CM1200mP2_05350 [Planctomycetaceae bacterium]